MPFNSFLDPVLGPLFVLPTLWAIIAISFLISLLIVVIYKFTTDQNLMKQLKGELKEFQKQVKELKDEPQKAMAVQKKAMETNMKYMMQSLKPTLFTFIPIILIFGWLNGALSFEPILPGETVNLELAFEESASGDVEIFVPEQMEVLGEKKKTIEPLVVYSVRGTEEGEYLMDFRVDGVTYSKNIVISETGPFAEQTESVDASGLKEINIVYNKLIVLNLFGWRLGWLGTYIIASIIFSLVLRRMMKVY